MTRTIKRIVLSAALAAATLITGACNSSNRESSPVKLLVTNDQNLQQIDLSGGTRCTENIATVNLQAIVIQGSTANLPTDNRLNDVVIDRYQVTYQRTDGGKAVPQSFVRSISGVVVAAGGAASLLTQFLGFQPDAITQAPFASLLPVNGGRDPETGKAFVQMEVILTVYGTTLAGERVSGTTHIPINFCYSCNGCG